jgi:Tol biopolymer transport system component
MGRMTDVLAVVLVLVALGSCSEGSLRSGDEVALATASASPVAALAAAAEYASPPTSLHQDTARTVTRRVWADADLYSLSPDGRYASLTDWETGDLAIRDMETGEVRRLTHNSAPYEPGEAEHATFSRDGKWVAYSWYDEDEPAYYKLGVVDVEGTNPRLVHRDRATLWIDPADWSPDGRWILANRTVTGRAEILLVSPEDGSTRLLKAFDVPSSCWGSHFSPDGRYVSYECQQDDPEDRDIFVVDVATGEEHALVTHPANDRMLGWAPDGKHVLFRSDRSGTPGAWLLPVADGEPSGAPWLVKPDMWRARGVGFTQDGRYFYLVRTGKRDVYVASFDPESRSVIGSPRAITAHALGDRSLPGWSPDGRHLVYRVERGQDRAAGKIVVHSLETGELREFDLGTARWVGHIGWTADGRSVLARASNPDSEEDRIVLYRLDVQTGSKEVVLRSGKVRGYLQLSPDERFWFYWRAEENQEGQARFTIVREELETGDTTELFQTPYGHWGQIRGMDLSPDGRTLAFGYFPPGDSTRLVLLPVDGGEARELPIREATGINWMPDGEALLFRRFVEVGPLYEVLYLDLAEGEPHPIGLTVSGNPGLDIHPDGRRIAYASGKGGAELWVMENFLPEGTAGR